MRSLVKPALLSLFGLGCAVLTTDAQSLPTPAAPAAPPVPPTPVVVQALPPGTVPVEGRRIAFAQTAPAAAAGDVLTYRATVVGGDPHAHTFYMTADGNDPEAKKIAKQLADAKTEADKEKLKEKLKDHLAKQFDEKQKRHDKEIEALEAQVKKLKEMVGKRQDNKKEIIDERMKQLQREAAGLGW